MKKFRYVFKKEKKISSPVQHEIDKQLMLKTAHNNRCHTFVIYFLNYRIYPLICLIFKITTYIMKQISKLTTSSICTEKCVHCIFSLEFEEKY